MVVVVRVGAGVAGGEETVSSPRQGRWCWVGVGVEGEGEGEGARTRTAAGVPGGAGASPLYPIQIVAQQLEVAHQCGPGSLDHMRKSSAAKDIIDFLVQHTHMHMREA